MKRVIKYLAMAMILSALVTCRKENRCDCIKRTGSIVKEERQPGSFRSVFVEDNVNLIFIEDSVAFLEVEAGENIVDLIKTEINGDWLNIRNENKCNFTRRYDIPVNVYVHAPPMTLQHIITRSTGNITNKNPCTVSEIDLEIQGSGDIEFTVAGGKVLTHQHGAGDITLHGSANEVVIYTTGTGFTIADDCANPYTWVYTRTTGKITVCPINVLICEIAGSGHVYYKGIPNSIQCTRHSTGELLPLP
ncbi:MAG TPA: head GIN domain-containing protein [Bacteroidia bacterium]|nr:head GIN domain-containing protein [Bacteroidia bacterium]